MNDGRNAVFGFGAQIFRQIGLSIPIDGIDGIPNPQTMRNPGKITGIAVPGCAQGRRQFFSAESDGQGGTILERIIAYAFQAIRQPDRKQRIRVGESVPSDAHHLSAVDALGNFPGFIRTQILAQMSFSFLGDDIKGVGGLMDGIHVQIIIPLIIPAVT